MISALSKLIENLIYKRLIKYLDKYKIINNFQYGFRTAHSTNHAILDINENILAYKDQGLYTASIYSDF